MWVGIRSYGIPSLETTSVSQSPITTRKDKKGDIASQHDEKEKGKEKEKGGKGGEHRTAISPLTLATARAADGVALSVE